MHLGECVTQTANIFRNGTKVLLVSKKRFNNCRRARKYICFSGLMQKIADFFIGKSKIEISFTIENESVHA